MIATVYSYTIPIPQGAVELHLERGDRGEWVDFINVDGRMFASYLLKNGVLFSGDDFRPLEFPHPLER